MNKALARGVVTALGVVKAVLLAPLRKVAPGGVREAATEVATKAAAKVIGVAHKTNPSGNNMSQR